MTLHGTRLIAVSTLSFAFMTIAVACGGPTKTSGITPSASAPTSSEIPARPTGPARSTGTTYPLTITDMLGRTVTIKARPQAVAALSPTTVELVYAVGGTSKTRSSNVDYPPGALSAVSIGSWGAPDLAAISATKPDLIVADMLQAQLKPSLEGLGVPVIFEGAQNFDEVGKALRLVGRVLDRTIDGNRAASQLEQQLADLKRSLPVAQPKVLVLSGAPNSNLPFVAAKPDSYVGSLVQLLGGDDVVKAGEQAIARYPGYTELSLDAARALQPDVVLTITVGPPGTQTVAKSLLSNAAWKDVPAVKNGRVSEISAELFLWAPGPRVGDALATLSKALFPGRGGQQ